MKLKLVFLGALQSKTEKESVLKILIHCLLSKPSPKNPNQNTENSI